jgi:hypothetical protein
MMGARRGVERGNNKGKEVMARLEHARLGNVMTYGLMNDGMFGRGKISLYVWLYNGGELVIKYSFAHITHHRKMQKIRSC